MPCSCDGYDGYEAGQARKELDHERKLRCRAQSLAHKLAKVMEGHGLVPSGELGAAIRRERASLLEHKRAENQQDIKKAEDAFTRIAQTIEQITKLGGVPGDALLTERDNAKAKVVALSAITDAELLG